LVPSTDRVAGVRGTVGIKQISFEKAAVPLAHIRQQEGDSALCALSELRLRPGVQQLARTAPAMTAQGLDWVLEQRRVELVLQ
jgi:hypothetical protein